MAERALVTGASGFVGAALVRCLLDEGSDVVALARPASDTWRLDDVLDSIELLREPLDLRGGVTVVYHLAAAGVRPDSADPETVVETNVLGTLRALELARELEAPRFVYCGSCFEYTPGERLAEDAPLRPSSEYAASKSAGWLLAQAFALRYGLSTVGVRPFTVYGPFEPAYRLVASSILSALSGSTIELTHGEQTRDLVDVGDAATAFVAAARSGAEGIYNVCTGVSTRVRDVARLVADLTDSAVEVAVGAVPERDVEYASLSGDPTRAAEELGWRASVPLEEGLMRTIDWFREHRDRFPEYARAEVRG